nr:beta-ketoacyl synthase N-terminal-like domain-containing protein [Angustibacter aerolatus]
MAPTKRIVVTGLGATTPIGGDVPSTWQAALDGVSGGRTLTQDWVAQHEPAGHLRRPRAGPRSRRPAEGRDPPSGPVRAVRADRRSRGLGRRRHPRHPARAARRRAGHRHRRHLDPARPVGQPAREGPAPGLPADRAHAHAQQLGRRDQHRASARGPAPTPRSAPARPVPRRSPTRRR